MAHYLPPHHHNKAAVIFSDYLSEIGISNGRTLYFPKLIGGLEANGILLDFRNITESVTLSYAHHELNVPNSVLLPPRITKRLYNTQTGEWNIYDGDDDNLCRYHTEFTNDSIIITDATSTAPKMRWLLKEIELHSFKWECQTSSDNGKSWKTIEELIARRRLASK